MKAKITLILVVLIVLTSCSKESSREEILLKKYETAYSELVSNTKFEEKSEYFKLEVVTNTLSNGTYRVDLIIDEPQVAMYNIQVLMELDSKGIEQFDSINASLGIVDDTQYNMIPYQVKEEHSFYEGLILSELSSNNEGIVRVMIAWTNYSSTQSFVEFFELPYASEDVRSLRLNNMDKDIESEGNDE